MNEKQKAFLTELDKLLRKYNITEVTNLALSSNFVSNGDILVIKSYSNGVFDFMTRGEFEPEQ